MNKIEQKFKELYEKKSDINAHMHTLRKYAQECNHITEMGVRWIVSTWAFLSGYPERMVSFDIKHPSAFNANLDEVYEATKDKIDFDFFVANVLEVEIEETDLLFIDTWHIYRQLQAELSLHAGRVRKYIILHDTHTFGIRGEDGGEGLKKALNEFLEANPEWIVKENFTHNNGLTVLEKVKIHDRTMPSALEKAAIVAGYDEVGVGPSKHKKKWEVKPNLEFGKKKFIKPSNVKFIIPFPDTPHYLWQVMVQMQNFSRYGYDVDAHYIVGSFNGKISPLVKKIARSGNIKSTFHVYHDLRTPEENAYRASLKPWLLAQYFRDYPEAEKDAYVLLDPDVIFLEDMDWSQFLGDDIWYESDARPYMNTKYIKSKGEQLFYDMCKIVGISPEIVIANDENCGGAQYVTKNNTHEFWEQVWRLSVPLWKHMEVTKDIYKPKNDPHPIQAWTAEMWTTNWCAWKEGIITKVSPELHFHWANHFAKIRNHKIYHNAGITKFGEHFYRGGFQDSPFGKDLKTKEESLSIMYTHEIRNTEKAFPDLIW